MLDLLVLLAAEEAQFPGIVGGAGWVGAGMLGSVLAWLLFIHLPAKDKQIEKLIDRQDTFVKNITDRHEQNMLQAVKEGRTDFREVLDGIVANCQREHDLLHNLLTKDMAENATAITDLRRVMDEFRKSHA
jgi:hypothetical protein